MFFCLHCLPFEFLDLQIDLELKLTIHDGCHIPIWKVCFYKRFSNFVMNTFNKKTYIFLFDGHFKRVFGDCDQAL